MRLYFLWGWKELRYIIKQCWCWSFNTLATWWEELIHWKRPWCWEKLRVGEGSDRGWDGWKVSLTQWTWVWASSRSWRWTGKTGVLQSMWLQRVDHDLVNNKIKQCGQFYWNICIELHCNVWSCFKDNYSIFIPRAGFTWLLWHHPVWPFGGRQSKLTLIAFPGY